MTKRTVARADIQCSERICEKGTRNGEAAQASRYGFAPCIRLASHLGPCDSGPAPDSEPPRRAA